MPGEQFLLLQMHELLTYLNQQGVITLMVLGQHGLIGDMRTDIDLQLSGRHRRAAALFRGERARCARRSRW